MQKLTDVLDKYNLTGRVLTGMDKLVGEDRALDAFMVLEDKWHFMLNHKATSRTGQCRYPHNGGYFRGRRGYTPARLFGEVEINRVLMNEGHEATRDNTILHEVAHAVDQILNGKSSGHGLNWKRIMIAFGCKPERCNTDQAVSDDLDVQRARKCKLMYKCRRCEHEFPAMRKKKHPVQCYSHRGCGGQFYLQRDAVGRTYPNPGANTQPRQHLFGLHN